MEKYSGNIPDETTEGFHDEFLVQCGSTSIGIVGCIRVGISGGIPWRIFKGLHEKKILEEFFEFMKWSEDFPDDFWKKIPGRIAGGISERCLKEHPQECVEHNWRFSGMEDSLVKLLKFFLLIYDESYREILGRNAKKIPCEVLVYGRTPGRIWGGFNGGFLVWALDRISRESSGEIS